MNVAEYLHQLRADVQEKLRNHSGAWYPVRCTLLRSLPLDPAGDKSPDPVLLVPNPAMTAN
jgi:hypothetical protein